MHSHNTYVKGLSSPHKCFRDEATRLSTKFESDAYVISGIVRWRSNDRVPPKDILEFWDHLDKPFDYIETLRVLDEETTASLEAYRRAQENRVYSHEELSEMRAAFG